MIGSANAVAAVLTAPRTFELQEFALPNIGDDDGLLRVEACGLCGSDWEQFKGELGRGFPIIPGHEIIGRVEKLGKAAKTRWSLAEGDRVALDASIPCGTCHECRAGAYKRCPTKLGYGMHVLTTKSPGIWGGYATHAYLHPRSLIHRLPENVPTSAMTLFNALSNAVSWTVEVGGVGLGGSIVICGPGQRGLLAVVAAREAGAERIIITGKKNDRERLDLAKRLGATNVIDVDATDPIEAVKEITRGAGVDVVLDVSAGGTDPIVQAVDMARLGGKIILAGVKGNRMLSGLSPDKILLRELHLVGVRSSGSSATEKAIRIIERNADELVSLCTHNYDLRDVNKAVLVLGRELDEGEAPVHVRINGTI
jgi:threonine dehydrogenase-like Zn-dependent dehydrogenase